MSSFNGRNVVDAIERLLEKQAQDAQETKQVATIRLVSEFAGKNQIPAQSGAVATISRIVRKLDDEGIRQVRSLSDSLLNKDEETLRSELESLRDSLMPIEARVHQVKTRTAFVATALRPFSSKYTSKWFSERKDLDVPYSREQVSKLESRKLSDADDINAWAKEVASLFERVVIYRGSDAEDYYTRPAGTVNERSSRTYVQAWLSFTEKFKEDIWSLATGGELKTDYDFKLSRSEEFQYEAATIKDTKSKLVSHGLSLAPPKTIKVKVDSIASPRTKLARTSESKPAQLEWVKVYIESKIDSSAQATRKWESVEDFESSIQKWLDTFPIIWGPAADEFLAKISVKTLTGESDLTLPKLIVTDAAERLTKAVAMQQN